jgi:hypothetical protein
VDPIESVSKHLMLIKYFCPTSRMSFLFQIWEAIGYIDCEQTPMEHGESSATYNTQLEVVLGM